MNIIIAGGGTGGHLFPGIAVYERLKSINPDIEVYFIGTEKGIENKLKDDYDFKFFTINVKGFSGKSLMSKIQSVKELFKAAKEINMIYKAMKPEFVLGLGGYISFMPLAMAKLKGIRSGVMEQNAVPGLSNKILGLLGITIFASFEETKKYLPFSRVTVTGNPVRKKILEMASSRANEISKGISDGASEGWNKKDFSVFIFGGSQGASSLNNAAISMLPLLDKGILSSLTVFHQTGDKDYKSVKDFYDNSGTGRRIKKFEIFPFTKNMEHYYVESDIVISRSGAGTLSELIVLRKPAILVPYPYAVKNHQEANARVFSKKGCFYIVKDDKNLPKELLQTISKIFYNRKLLNNMHNNLRKIDIEDSALKIAGIILGRN